MKESVSENNFDKTIIRGGIKLFVGQLFWKRQADILSLLFSVFFCLEFSSS